MTDNTHPSDARLHELMKQEEEAWRQAAAAADRGSENERTTKARAWWVACDRLLCGNTSSFLVPDRIHAFQRAPCYDYRESPNTS
jgi:hypothetical protein